MCLLLSVSLFENHNQRLKQELTKIFMKKHHTSKNTSVDFFFLQKYQFRTEIRCMLIGICSRSYRLDLMVPQSRPYQVKQREGGQGDRPPCLPRRSPLWPTAGFVRGLQVSRKGPLPRPVVLSGAGSLAVSARGYKEILRPLLT